MRHAIATGRAIHNPAEALCGSLQLKPDEHFAAIDRGVRIQEAPRRRRRRELAGMESASAESVIADIREQFGQR
jgi:hypothetical protein